MDERAEPDDATADADREEASIEHGADRSATTEEKRPVGSKYSMSD